MMLTDGGILERCDACGHQAQVTVMAPASGSELNFCKHHFEAMRDALLAQGFDIVVADTRADLVPALPTE